MKLAKIIHLDVSDQNIFPIPAEPGEWAITGTFGFVDADAHGFVGKQKIAFKSGWMGLNSFGRSTLVQVANLTAADHEQCIRRLASHLFSTYGAPDMLAAIEAAKLEINDMASLCEHAPGTLLAIGREAQPEGIAEQVRIVKPPDTDDHARMWDIVSDDA